MSPTATAARLVAPIAVPPSRRREHRFYTGMALAIAVVVFAGFARSYFLRPYFSQPPLAPLLHLHGLVFTSWILLLVAQTTLVSAGRTDLHRRLGVAGAAIAGLMILVGGATAIIRAGQGAAPAGIPPLTFLVIPLADIAVFTTLVATAFHFRRRPDVHKRLMLLATISLLAAPIARLPFAIMRAGPPAFFGLADLFLVACLTYDLVTRRRVHRATALGALFIVASQPLRLMLGGTAAWLGFAGWLTR